MRATSSYRVWSRSSAVVVSICSLGIGVGCGIQPDQGDAFRWLWNSLSIDGQSVPAQVPPELLIVRSQPDRFSSDDHPLLTAPDGLVVDDLSELAGCWGRATAEWTWTPPCCAGPSTVIEVLIFNPEEGNLTHHRLREYQCSPIVANRYPDFESWEAEYNQLDESRISRKIISGEGGALASDGSAIFSLWAMAGATASVDHEWETAITLSGDALRTDDGSIDSTVESPENVRYWRRMDCAE